MSPMHVTQALLSLPSTPRMPGLFIGHGSPMNGIEENSYVTAWKNLATNIPRPKAILSISAHWLTRGTEVHISPTPRTIHDFYGFPDELYNIIYPCSGAPHYAQAVKEIITGTSVTSDTTWGLDHGTWVVLHRMYPDANIPVFQMSIDMTRPHEFHYTVAKELALLRKHGVLILGSGNLVHNLGMINFSEPEVAYNWATDFDAHVKEFILTRDHQKLIQYEKLGHEAMLSVPTPENYWPLLYILGLQEHDEGATFPIEGITYGSISMRAVLIG